MFGGSTGLEVQTNLLVQVFTDPAYVAFFSDYELVARHLVAMFRLDYGPHIDDPRTQELVQGLRATSPAFNDAWQRHGIQAHPEGVREIMHPSAGRLMLAPSLYEVTESPGLRIMVFCAADALTAARIAHLTETFAASDAGEGRGA